MRSLLALLVVLAFVADVSAQSRRQRRQMEQQSQWSQQNAAVMGGTVLTMNPAPAVTPAPASSWRTEESKKSEPTSTTITAGQECADALTEVNANRAQRGLRPFINDPLLAQGALACARVRAASHHAGHCDGQRGDFAYLPAGAQATAGGCGALELSWGWGTCCTYDNYTYCGAAWVMGNDGRRYMHLFVR